jgi:hypothetical protein
MSETASLTVKMGLDGKPLKDGLNSAKGEVRSFAASFKSELGETKGAVKDVAGTIEGMSRAFDGSVSGAVGGFKDFIGLLKTSPLLSIGGLVAGVITAIATSAEKAANDAAEKLAKSIEEFKRLRKEVEDIKDRSAKKDREDLRPEAGTREAIDFAREDFKMAEQAYQAELKRNEELKKRSALHQQAQRDLQQMMQSGLYGESNDVADAVRKLTPNQIGATGESIEQQRAYLARRGFMSSWTAESLTKAANDKASANDLEKSVRDVYAANEKMGDARRKLNEITAAYDKRRLSENEQSTKAAYDKERKMEEDRLKMMAEGHKEAADLARKNGEELVKIEEQAAEKRREAWKKEAEDKAQAQQDAAAEMSALESGKDRFSSRFSADQYARVGGEIGGRSNMRELRDAEKQAQLLEKGNDITAKMLNRIEKIESVMAKAVDGEQ